MNALKKRSVAIAITAVVIVAAIFGGSHRSLMAVRAEAEALYETGTGADGSIMEDQERQMEICSNLAVVAQRYWSGKELDTLEAAVEYFRTGGEQERAKAYRTARAAADELLKKLLLMSSVTEQDAGYLASFESQLASYDYTIARNGYNDAAQTFNSDVLGKFPANVLGRLTGVSQLEVYR